jgi:hypothetical protein
MGTLSADEVKKDLDAQKKKFRELRAASKDARKDLTLRAAHKALRRLQRRWRQMTGKKNAKPAAAGAGEAKK